MNNNNNNDGAVDDLLRLIDDEDSCQVPADFDAELWLRMQEVINLDRSRRTSEAHEHAHVGSTGNTQTHVIEVSDMASNRSAKTASSVRLIAAAAALILLTLGLQQRDRTNVERLETTNAADRQSTILGEACQVLEAEEIMGLPDLAALARQTENRPATPDSDAVARLATSLAKTTDALRSLTRAVENSDSDQSMMAHLNNATLFLDQAQLELDAGDLTRARASIASAASETTLARNSDAEIPCLDELS